MKLILEEIFEHIDKVIKDSNNSLVLLAIEFNPEGYPVTQTIKVTGSPAASIAGLTMLRSMIDSNLKTIDDNLKSAIDANAIMDEIKNIFGDTDIEAERLKDFINNTTEGEKLKDLLNKLKKDFGK
jgi:hypothetical protein